MSFDGAFWNTNVVNTPFLVVSSDRPDPEDEYRNLVTRIINLLGFYMNISGTGHWSYSGMPLIPHKSTFTSMFGAPVHPMTDAMRVTRLTSLYVVSFFKRFLTAEDDHLLDQPPAEYPEILDYWKSASP